MSDAKAEILARISAAAVKPAPEPDRSFPASIRDRAVVVDQFCEYVEDYKARVQRIAATDIAGAVLALVGDARLLVPGDLPVEWKGAPAIVVDNNLSHQELDGCGAVLTGCRLGIAETGTIVLDGGPAQGRRAITLIPDHHICVVFESQIVDTIPEAVAALKPSIDEGRPLTWISGPSATSDIELNRVEGVHGPRRLDVLVVKDYLGVR